MIMSFLRQTGLAIILFAIGVVGVARYLPASHDALNSIGVPQWVISAVSQHSDDAPQNREGGQPRGEGGGGPATVVITAPVSTGVVSTQVQAVGSGDALSSVSVVPLDAGVLVEVAVQSGDFVAAGDVLAKLNGDIEEIARDRAVVALQAAQASLSRYQGLSELSAASQADLETLQTSRDDAVLALREAVVAFEQRTILAPIAGAVGIVPVSIGDYVTTETEIVTIDDRSKLVIAFWVPESVSGQVAVGQQVTATSMALSGTAFEGTVNEIGSRIETDSRTLEVHALLDNSADLLRPGMSFSISLGFDGETYPSVDTLAVQWDADGSYVWVVTDDVATRTPARIVQRNADTILIDPDDVIDGMQVITEGTLNVRDGATVTTQSEPPPDGNIAAFGEPSPDQTQQSATEDEG
jgi:RND family efflux transporter MFP subunit